MIAVSAVVNVICRFKTVRSAPVILKNKKGALTNITAGIVNNKCDTKKETFILLTRLVSRQ